MLGRIALVVLVAAVAATPAAGGIANPSPVVATTKMEAFPGASLDWLVWTQGPYAKHKQRVIMARPLAGGATFRVNPRRTTGYVNSGAVDGSMLVYRQRKFGRRYGDLKLFNLDTRTRSNPPAGVNTKDDEYGASRSGDWLLFVRYRARRNYTRIILFNLATHAKRVLDVTRTPSYSQTGTVNGEWAVWTRCRWSNHCHTFRYNIATKTRLKVPNPGSRSQYAASVTADGTVYFAESSDIYCGNGFGIWRYPVGGPRERLVALRRGLDAIVTSPVVNPDTSVTVYFDRTVCRTHRYDVYKFTVPAP